MIQIIPERDRHHARHGWLDARWHFSFADYHDPDNVSFGPLRVFNDDVIQGGGGFEPHPHRDMEIVSYVIDGALEHQDNMGNRHVSTAGGVQVMTAGSGVVHSEFNPSPDQPMRLNQIWLMPRSRRSRPRWEARAFSRADRMNRWLPIVSSGDVAGTLAIDQDAVIQVAALDKDNALTHSPAEGRRAYLFVIQGGVTVNGLTLAGGDQARITGESKLDIVATEASELILLDLP